MSLLGRFKHADSYLDMAVDFSNRLATGETLASAPVMTVKGANYGEVSDLTVGTASISGTTVTARISGGSAAIKVDEDRWETEYCIKCQVVTSSGETESEDVKLTVYDCRGTGT